MRNVSEKTVEETKAHALCSVNFFFLNRAVYEITSKSYCGAGQATGDNIALAHCMLDS